MEKGKEKRKKGEGKGEKGEKDSLSQLEIPLAD